MRLPCSKVSASRSRSTACLAAVKPPQRGSGRGSAQSSGDPACRDLHLEPELVGRQGRKVAMANGVVADLHPRGGEVGEQVRRGVHHQVPVQHALGDRTEGAHDRRAERERRDEPAVHHVDVQPVNAGHGGDFFHSGHLIAQAGKVGGQDARGNSIRTCHGHEWHLIGRRCWGRGIQT